MPSFRSSHKQADLIVRRMAIQSLGTQRNYAQALRGYTEFTKLNHHLGDLRTMTRETALTYLEFRSQLVSQKTLDLDRQATQKFLGEKLPVIKSELVTALSTRAYPRAQVALVAAAQSAKHSLSTELALDAGLRAHELITLQPLAMQPPSAHREFRQDLFTGRDVVIFTVAGKGGLKRQVGISHALSVRLEECRLPEPRDVTDRGIPYRSLYNLGGGKQWSDSFSKASTRELGWSNGAHGLRHSYAQERMHTLQSGGYFYKDALALVSQEMGHFRPDITEVYLR